MEFELTITNAIGANPEVSTVTLDEINENNDEVEDLLAALGQLAIGNIYTDGGGAQPIFIYRRTK